jgi:threonine aldolase
MFCLSKGLCSPVGSMLVGTKKFIARARRLRKMLGGGMRQVGVLAAAGIISLERMTKRLGEDHERARKLAEGLRQIKGLVLDAGTPYTNMIYLNLAESIGLNAFQITDRLKQRGVLVDPENDRRFRLVTHHWFDGAAVDKTVQAFAEALK